jgi:ribosomal protein L29
MTDQTKDELKSENDELKAKLAELEGKVSVNRSTFPNHHAPGYAPHERDAEGNPQP